MKNRLPWIIAALAVAIAILVVVYERSNRATGSAATTSREHPNVNAAPVVINQITPPPAAATISPAVSAGTPEPQPSEPIAGNTLTGKVSDLQGKPIPGATITMFFNVSRNQEKLTVKTDATGAFRARGIKWDEIDILSIDAAGFSSFVEKTPIPLPLPDPLQITLNRLGGAELRILAVRGTGQPEPFSGEATVSILKRNDRATTASGGESVDARYTALFTEPATITDGRYSIQALAPGVYKAAALTKEEYAESDPFTLETGAAPEAVIILGLRRPFAGIVKSARSQNPVAGAKIHMINSGRPLPLGRAQQLATESAPDGAFQFEAISPGTYSLMISAAGFTTKTIEELPVPVSQQAGTPETFLLSEGHPALTVTVMNSTGNPLAQAPLVVFSNDNSAQPRSFFSRTDAAGAARFDTIPSGRYMVAATSPENRTRQKSAEINVLEGQPLAVEIRFGRTVKVTGTARTAGKPLNGLVSFVPRGQVGMESYSRADESGMFAAELEPGEYVAKRQGQTETTIVTIPDLETASIELDLK